MATLTRRVEFSDYNSPRFSLSGPLVFEEGITNLKNVRAMFSATDILDGDLSGWVTYVNSDADFNKAGTYSITMEVRNSLGDTVSYDFRFIFIVPKHKVFLFGLRMRWSM